MPRIALFRSLTADSRLDGPCRPYLSVRRCRSCGRPFAPELGAAGLTLEVCTWCRRRAGRVGFCRDCGSELERGVTGRPRLRCVPCEGRDRRRYAARRDTTTRAYAGGADGR